MSNYQLPILSFEARLTEVPRGCLIVKNENVVFYLDFFCYKIFSYTFYCLYSLKICVSECSPGQYYDGIYCRECYTGKTNLLLIYYCINCQSLTKCTLKQMQ